MNQFVHLHTHSHYSLLDSCVKINDLVEKAVEFGMPALAITDHGNLSGIVEFWKVAKKNKIKPIFGCEMYVAMGSLKERKFVKGRKHYWHLVLLAKNERGFRNLIQLVSIGHLDGFYYRPRIDEKLLAEHTEGLIALSGCIGGKIPQIILENGDDLSLAEREILSYRDMFEKDSFFLELQGHDMEEQKKVNVALRILSERTGVPTVVTNDVHYLLKGDAASHDIFFCIGQQDKWRDSSRKRLFKGEDFYFKSREEMYSLFPHDKDALLQTVRIADMCESIDLDVSIKMPKFPLDSSGSLSAREHLLKLCKEGLNQKIPNRGETEKTRLDYEMNVILSMGFEDYFLIVWDFIRWARSNGIAVGPGRGSVAGSLVAYALDITQVNPLRHGLLFERFLNPERISLPDIDTDFQDDRRDEVIGYISRKYGKDKVCGISTFGSLKSRAVLRDVGRVLDIPLKEVDRVAKLIPQVPGMSLRKALDSQHELQALKGKFLDIASSSSKAKVKELFNKEHEQGVGSTETLCKESYDFWFDSAVKLEGVYRNSGTHAAGIIISSKKLLNVVPLFKDSKTSSILAQYEGEHLEACGFLKVDILGLRNLSVIQKCILSIPKLTSVDDIPDNDVDTYRLLCSGQTVGLFQLESAGMKELLMQSSPSVFEDIVALIALYRPGPIQSGMTKEFVSRKRGAGKVEFKHPLLEEVLKETRGVIVYQEQVMSLARIVGGFSRLEADRLRKAMGKKISKTMEEMEIKFLKGSQEKKFPLSLAKKLYKTMSKFGQYGFNKSHSAAYAVITYQTAFLKANYPVEYLGALLNCEKDNSGRFPDYIQEAKRMNIAILPPDIQKSSLHFTMELDDRGAKCLRFGLVFIRHVGEKIICSLLDKREKLGTFHSFSNACMNIRESGGGKKVAEALIKSGALDMFGRRENLLEIWDDALHFEQEKEKRKQSNQFDLFGEEDEQCDSFETWLKRNGKVAKPASWTSLETLLFEKEYLGFYFSGHPLDEHEEVISLLPEPFRHSVQQRLEIPDETRMYFAGLIVEIERKMSKKGKAWALVILETFDGRVELIFFEKLLNSLIGVLEKGKILLAVGLKDKGDTNRMVVSACGFLGDSFVQKINIENKRHWEDFVPWPFGLLPKSKASGNNRKDAEFVTSSLRHVKPNAVKNVRDFLIVFEALDEEEFLRSLDAIEKIILQHPGSSKVFAKVVPRWGKDVVGQQVCVRLGALFCVDATSELQQKISAVFGVRDACVMYNLC